MITDATLLTATTTGSGSVVDLGGTARRITIYMEGAGTISGGAVTFETAHEANYAGTWAPIDSAYTVTTLSGGKSIIKQYDGPFRAVRARINTDLSGGGTMSAWIVGSN